MPFYGYIHFYCSRDRLCLHMVFVQSLIIELHEIDVRNYDGAVFAAANLAAEGLIAFELCRFWYK